MARTCSACGRDPGSTSRCRHCGEPVYRFAIDSDDWDEAAGPDGRISTDDEPERQFGDDFDDEPVGRYGDDFDDEPVGQYGDDFDDDYFGDEDVEVPDVVIPPPNSDELGFRLLSETPDSIPEPRYSPPPARPAPTRAATGPGTAQQRQQQQARGCRGCLVVGLVVLLVLVAVGTAFFFLVGNAFDTDGGFDSGDIAAVPGECIDLVGNGDVVTNTETVPCDAPHDAEVYFQEFFADGAYPGDTVLADQAEDVCLGAFEGYVATDYFESEFFYDWLIPTGDGWASGDRELLCLLVSGDGSPLQGSGFQSGR